jgi:signal transduction histidine kinase
MNYPPFIDAILSHHRIAFLLASRELRVLAIGGTALRVLGLGDPAVQLLDLLPELEGSEAELQLIADGGADPLTIEYLRRGSGEALRYYAVHVVPYSNNPPGAGLLVTIRDVTAEGLRFQELAQRTNEGLLLRAQIDRQNLELGAANVELRQLAELKSMFVAMTAHELRNPLTVALGYLDLVLDSRNVASESEQQQMLEQVQIQLRRLSRISRELLDLATIEAGRIELILRPVDLEAVVRGVASEHSAILAAREQRLLVECEAGLELGLVDEARVVQVLSNLIGNASKFTPADGLITLRLFTDQQQGFVVIAVCDTGIGIPPEDQARLFQRFFRSGPARAMDTGGTGLGLFIARAFVDLHGGRIWCESVPGQGSSFYVSLPTISDSAELLRAMPSGAPSEGSSHVSGAR